MSSKSSILHRIDSDTRDVIHYLKNRDEICDLYIDEIEGASKIQLSEWEIKYMCTLPQDLKTFYSNHNGLLIEWKCKLDKATILPLGKIQVNSLKDLTRVGSVLNKDFNEPSVFDLEDIQPADDHDHDHNDNDRSTAAVGRTSAPNRRRRPRRSRSSASGVESDVSSNLPTTDEDDDDDDNDDEDGNEDDDDDENETRLESAKTRTSASSAPRFDDTCRNFELDNCNGYGKICLVYRDCRPGETTVNSSSPQVWYLDRSLTWHFLASSFANYYRLLLAHLGLPQWPMLFTPDGIPPNLNQWFYMFAPGRILIQQDYWKEMDNLKLVTENSSPSLAATSSSSSSSSNATKNNNNNNPPSTKRTVASGAAAAASASQIASRFNDANKNKIDFSLFEDKQSKTTTTPKAANSSMLTPNERSVSSTNNNNNNSNNNNHPKGRSSSNKK